MTHPLLWLWSSMELVTYLYMKNMKKRGSRFQAICHFNGRHTANYRCWFTVSSVTPNMSSTQPLLAKGIGFMTFLMLSGWWPYPFNAQAEPEMSLPVEIMTLYFIQPNKRQACRAGRLRTRIKLQFTWWFWWLKIQAIKYDAAKS